MHSQPGPGQISPAGGAFPGFHGVLTAYRDRIPGHGAGGRGGPRRAVGGAGGERERGRASCRISCILTYFAGFPAFCGFPPPAAPPGAYDTIYSVLLIYHTTTYSSSTIYSRLILYYTLYIVLYIYYYGPGPYFIICLHSLSFWWPQSF